MAKIKLPFSLDKPSATEYVTDAASIKVTIDDNDTDLQSAIDNGSIGGGGDSEADNYIGSSISSKPIRADTGTGSIAEGKIDITTTTTVFSRVIIPLKETGYLLIRAAAGVSLIVGNEIKGCKVINVRRLSGSSVGLTSIELYNETSNDVLFTQDEEITTNAINIAEGDNSHAEGCGSVARGEYSHTEGCYTITNNENEHAEGQYNKSHSSYSGADKRTIHSVGVGSGDSDRVNAHEIMMNGDHYLGKGKVFLREYDMYQSSETSYDDLGSCMEIVRKNLGYNEGGMEEKKLQLINVGYTSGSTFSVKYNSEISTNDYQAANIINLKEGWYRLEKDRDFTKKILYVKVTGTTHPESFPGSDVKTLSNNDCDWGFSLEEGYYLFMFEDYYPGSSQREFALEYDGVVHVPGDLDELKEGMLDTYYDTEEKTFEFSNNYVNVYTAGHYVSNKYTSDPINVKKGDKISSDTRFKTYTPSYWFAPIDGDTDYTIWKQECRELQDGIAPEKGSVVVAYDVAIKSLIEEMALKGTFIIQRALLSVAASPLVKMDRSCPCEIKITNNTQPTIYDYRETDPVSDEEKDIKIYNADLGINKEITVFFKGNRHPVFYNSDNLLRIGDAISYEENKTYIMIIWNGTVVESDMNLNEWKSTEG